MTNIRSLRRKGLIRVVVCAVILSTFGLLVAHWGWDGWMTGEVVVHPKGGVSFVARAVGPDAGAFQFRVWSYLVMGISLFVLGIGGLLFLLFASRERREAALLRAGLHNPTAGSPKAPRFLVIVVLSSLFAFLIYVGTRGV